MWMDLIKFYELSVDAGNGGFSQKNFPRLSGTIEIILNRFRSLRDVSKETSLPTLNNFVIPLSRCCKQIWRKMVFQSFSIDFVSELFLEFYTRVSTSLAVQVTTTIIANKTCSSNCFKAYHRTLSRSFCQHFQDNLYMEWMFIPFPFRVQFSP